MIHSIAQGGKHITVNGGYVTRPHFTMNKEIPLIGAMRYNSTSQNLEAFDGVQWVMMASTSPTIGLTPDAEVALSWAIKKMTEEAELETLATSSPAIKDLLAQKKELDHKITMVKTLIQKDAV